MSKYKSGLKRIRNFGLSRRNFNKGALGVAALSGLATAGIPGIANAATDVTFLGWEGYDSGLFVDSYLADNDINLNTTYIGNNDEIVSKLVSGGVGTIDIVTPYMGYIPMMVAADILQPIDESKVPNLSKVHPFFKDDPNIIVDGVRYGVPFTWGCAPMMYNTKVITSPPEAWADLFKPEYAGKIGMMDDPLGNIMLGAVCATDAEVATSLTKKQLDETIKYLISVKKIARLMTPSWGDLADAMARGDVVITFSGWETLKKFCADKGASHIDYVYPKEGTFAWLDTFSIAKDAPNADIDHKLCDMIIDVPAQKMIGDEFIQGITNSDAIAQLGISKDYYPYDDLSGLASKATFFAFPPLEEGSDKTTFNDWLEAYETFKSA